MEVTKTFANTLHYVILAKVRWFLRRSLYRYAISTAAIAYGLHWLHVGHAPSIASLPFLKLWGEFFTLVLAAGFVLQALAVSIQSARHIPRHITFREDEIVVVHRGLTQATDWNWIGSAEESSNLLVLSVRKFPRLELFLPKTKLTADELSFLREQLVAHNKLASNAKAN